jgi:hypothetical protein
LPNALPSPGAPLSRRVRILLFTLAGIALVVGATAVILALRFQSIAREYVMAALRERYHSDVQLGDLKISLFPSVRATGENLELRFAGKPGLPPMIRVRQFILDANFVSFFRNPKRIALIRLDGLEIQTPPRSAAGHSAARGSASGEQKFPFVLEEVIADSAVVETTPSDPSKEPLVFHIHQLDMHSIGIGQPMTFDASVHNAKPPGLIHTTGRFGPWNAEQPRDTPLSGAYTFRNADLGVFKGIVGTLSSDGQYHGQLAQLEVHGTADVPNFAIDIADHAVPLHTEFDATVDGTNGDTRLHPVHARLGNSSFEVTGSIARNALVAKKDIELEARAANAPLDSFLRLTVKSAEPPMTGRIGFNTKVKIPPGDTSVADRIQLDGTFTLGGIRFTSADVQSKLAGLSHRAQGHPNDHDPNVSSYFSGQFHLRNSRLSLPRLSFELPGAHITLTGGYGLRTSAIDLTGTAKLDATVSQMTTGIVSLLLRPVDPLLRRDGAGTVIPIRIQGTRGQPSFSIDIGRIIHRK